MDGVEEKITAKISVCFSERTLWDVRDRIWDDVKRSVGRCMCFV